MLGTLVFRHVLFCNYVVRRLVLEMAVRWVMRCRNLVVVGFFLHGWHLYVVLRAAEVSLAFVVVSTSLLLLLVVVSTCVGDVGRFVQFILICISSYLRIAQLQQTLVEIVRQYNETHLFE